MAPDAPRIAFGTRATASDPAARPRALEHLDALRSLIMGFDVRVDEARRLVGEFQRARDQLPPTIPRCFTASSGFYDLRRPG